MDDIQRRIKEANKIIDVCVELKDFFNEKAIPIQRGLAAMKLLIEITEDNLRGGSQEELAIN